MNILLVNDDGIESKRLKYTEKVLKNFGDVTVIAPRHQQSGKSVAISIRGFYFEKIDENFYAVDGTPADCVSFGIRGLDKTFDLVVSGTNRGYNLGVDTMYSGTVGAALQAAYLGYPSIALSADYKGFNQVEEHLKETFEYIFENKLLNSKHVININFPKEKCDSFNGFMSARTYYVRYSVKYKIENNYFETVREIIGNNMPKNSDYFAINNGYISIAKIPLKGDRL